MQGKKYQYFYIKFELFLEKKIDIRRFLIYFKWILIK